MYLIMNSSEEKKQSVIILPKYTKLTEEIIRKFDNLLNFASPDELRRNVTEIYHSYVINEHEILPDNFEKMATNLYFLIDFLDDADKELNPKETQE
jgi:hypothetical protein